MKIPENSDQANPPETLADNGGICLHCGEEFETHHALFDHVKACDEKLPDEPLSRLGGDGEAK